MRTADLSEQLETLFRNHFNHVTPGTALYASIDMFKTNLKKVLGITPIQPAEADPIEPSKETP